jgi:anti-sigma B factor antagonist
MMRLSGLAGRRADKSCGCGPGLACEPRRGVLVANGGETHLTFGRAAVVVIQREPDVVVRISGEVDVSNADLLEDAIRQWLRTNPGDLTLECDDLGFIDSTGLSLTVRLHNELTANGHRLVLAGLAPAVRRPFEVTNLIEVLDVREATP